MYSKKEVVDEYNNGIPKEINSINPNWYKINNKWHHCVTVISNCKIMRYVDGELQDNPIEQFEVGKWYTIQNTIKAVVCYKGVGENYGIDSTGSWGNSVHMYDITQWKEATPKEVEEALIKHYKEKICGKLYDGYTWNSNFFCGHLGCHTDILMENGKWIVEDKKEEGVTLKEINNRLKSIEARFERFDNYKTEKHT